MNWNDVLREAQKYFDMGNTDQADYNAFWAANIFLTWRWWFKLAMLVIPWVVWLFVRKRESSGRLLIAALFVMAASAYLDEMGIHMGLWYNAGRFNPYMQESTAFSLSMLPVTAMLFIQFFPRVRPVFKALAYGALGAFVMMPLMNWLGYFRFVHWTYLYSFVILFAMYWIAHRLAIYKGFDLLTQTKQTDRKEK